MNEMLRVSEVAAAAGVTAQTVRRWISEGRFPSARRVGPQQWRIPREELDAFMEGSA